MADITNVKVGSVDVTYNGVDLGHTMGGAEFSYEPQYMDATVDKYGQTVIQKYLTGESLKVKVKLAEFTIANLKVAMPNSTFAGAANARVTIGKSAGQSMLAQAAQLVLHPSNLGTRVNDIILHKAVVTSVVPLVHKIDEEKLIEVEFEAILDETKTNGNYLGMIGDSTA